MMLIGFGFLMAFSKSFSWSAVSYTFFMNAVMVQIYPLLSAFWHRVITDGFNSGNYYIYIDEVGFTSALYSAASMFITLGVVIGRVGPLECLIMSLVHEVGYTLNEVICFNQIKAFDVGGSMTIHTFGAYSGLAASLILTAIAKPNTKPGANYFSNLFGMIGTLFLWMYWPSFNFGVSSPTPFTKTQIIGNTILALTGSCLSTFITSAVVKDKFTMEHILNATLAGGVVIGATAGIIYHPGGSLAIGFLIGIVSTLGFQYLTPYLEKKFGLYDTCGVHNLHAMPGLIGGLVSAVVAASFAYPSATDAYAITANEFPALSALLSAPYKQGGLQIAATFTSAGIGIATAMVCGIFLRFIYSFDQKEFFTDSVYFEEAGEFI
jgi:ammonium transporter Rh